MHIQALESRTLFAASLAVVNASFENRATNSDPGVVRLTGWDLTQAPVANAFNPSDAAYTNATDTGPTQGKLAAPAAGKQHLFINGAGSVRQTLASTLEANKVYHLAVAVGNRGDLVMENWRISLFAGSTRIASGSGDGETIANFGWRNVSVASGAFGASSPLVGQPLRVELTNLSSKAAPALQVDFDNVRVTSADAPRTTSIAITNASFEKQAATRDKAVVRLTGWDLGGAVANAFNPNNLSFTNATDTGPTGGVLPGTAAGKQHLFINGAGTAKRTLTATLAANTTYKLTVAIGNRTDLVMENFRISLFAGTTRIATATGDAEAGPTATFRDVSATSAAFATGSALIGQQLRIELTALDAKSGNAIQVAFDNVRLTATRN